MAKPDVVYMALGGNDITNNADLTTMQARYNATIAIIKSKATVNIVLVSLMSLLDTADPTEDVRQAYNNWLEMNLPAGGIFYKDINTQLLSASDPRILDTKWTASPTNIHLSTVGYARVAEKI
jgi:lysophospholipase L1-like esterase